MKKLSFLVYLFVCALTACSTLSQDSQNKYFSNSTLLTIDYENAVIDSIIPDKSRIYSGLMEISNSECNSDQEWIVVDGRNMVLVATFIKDEYLQYWMNDEPFELKVDSWVTVPSEWTHFKQEFVSLNDKQGRIRMLQLLGMPHNGNHSVMVEFYADADKIFRPAKDPETTDSVASLEYPIGTTKEYREWFENHKEQTYKGNPAYPFTQLGYSYDWNRYSEKHIGLSEFVVPKGTLIKVKARTNYLEFLKKY